MQRRKIRSRQSNSANNSSLLYNGKVVLAKRKKPDGWLVISLQVVGVLFAFWLLYIAYFHTASLQFFVTWFYAHLGHDHAQHLVGQKYLQGYGVDVNEDEAIFWLKYELKFKLTTDNLRLAQAAQNGHPHASYNLAVAHFQGLNTSIDKEEAYHLIRHAARSGVEEARRTWEFICSEDDCSL